MKTAITCITALFAIILFSSNENGTDQDRRIFITVKIKNQVWMAENLNIGMYRNGDSIPEIKNPTEWAKLKTGAWCYYENKTENGIKYGKLYNWYAVNDSRGLAPRGFHIPSDEEWAQLISNLGEDEAGTKIKAKRGWRQNGNATNASGFGGLPGGYRYSIGSFLYAGNNGCFWSSTESDKNKAWGRTIHSNFSEVGRDDGSEGSGLSIRCIMD
jgi:uncharacterized protein (TIGR02145 family)